MHDYGHQDLSHLMERLALVLEERQSLFARLEDRAQTASGSELTPLWARLEELTREHADLLHQITAAFPPDNAREETDGIGPDHDVIPPERRDGGNGGSGNGGGDGSGAIGHGEPAPRRRFRTGGRLSGAATRHR